MTVTPLNNLQEFRDAIASEKGAVVDFHAEWCGPCKLISPKFEGFAEKYTNLSYYSVDVDAVPDVAEEVGIQAMPTFVAFRKGDKVGSLKGAIPAALETLVKEQDAIAAGAA